MTLSTKTGTENVCDTLTQVFRANMPAKITAQNALDAPYIRAHFGGPYVFAADSTLILSRNNGSATTYTIPASTYTVAQMITTLNGLSGFSTNYEAVSIMSGYYFEIRDKTKGALGSIKIGAGTANSIFGFADNEIHNYYPLQNIQIYRTQTRAMDQTLEANPSLVLFAEVNPDADGDGSVELIEYRVFARLYLALQSPFLTPEKEAMYLQLFKYFDLLRDVFYNRTYNAIWNSQVNSRRIIGARPGEEMLPLDRQRLQWLMWLDIDFEINVQELWQQ